MKNILFIHPYPFNTAGGQRFRYEQYVDILENNGFSLKFKSFLTFEGWKILYEKGKYFQKGLSVFIGFLKRFGLLFTLHRYEYVFIFREVTPLGPPIIEFAIAKIFRKKIIYDFDDAIWMENTTKENSLISKLKWHSKVSKNCKWSYKISAGNKFLAEYAIKFCNDVIINPTIINTDYHKPSFDEKNSNKIIIGWTGTHSTTKYLNLIVDSLKKIQKKYDVEYVFISDKSPNIDLNFTFLKWAESTEISDLQRLDIGLMPLTDSVWERGKCGFKALQYMGIGIPALVSPVGVNFDIVDHNVNGFHCNNADDWYTYLEALILDDSKRKAFGEKARDKIIDSYSVESNTKNFLSLFN